MELARLSTARRAHAPSTYRSINSPGVRLGVGEDIAEHAIGHVRADLVARYNKDQAWEGRSDAFTRVSDHIATAIGGAAQFC